MAGVGFQLKRLLEKDGIAAKIRAYSYAGSVVSGPMILGIVLLLGVIRLAQMNGADLTERELLITLMTYALLFSLITSSIFSLICTRYTADALYTGKKERVLPSFYGSTGLTLLIGGSSYGIYLAVSGIPFSYKVLSFLFYITLLVVWMEMTYLTAIGDFKNIIQMFFLAAAVLFISGFALMRYAEIDTAAALLGSAWLAYGLMAVRFYFLLLRYFPASNASPFHFLTWMERYPALFLAGILLQAGLYGHLLIMWHSSLQVEVRGLFRGAPIYDIAALIAVLSTLITSISFIASVEVHFYPEYRKYFSLLNHGGNIRDIEHTEAKMLKILYNELGSLAVKQIIATIAFITIGTVLLGESGIGFTGEMLGIYRVLCIGYAFFAIGNSLLLILLYFEDHAGAFYAAGLLSLSANLFTYFSKDWESSFYGFGFAAGTILFCFYAYWRMDKYLKNLKYHMIARQPIRLEEPDGLLARAAERFEKNWEKSRSQE